MPAMPADFKNFFAAAEKGNWLVVSNTFLDLKSVSITWRRLPAPTFRSSMECSGRRPKEIWGAFAALNVGDMKYSAAFGNDIIASIPPGQYLFRRHRSWTFHHHGFAKIPRGRRSIFFAYTKRMADVAYLDYLRSMYGKKIYVPTSEDSKKCFQDYTADVTRRQQNHQLKPGEDVKVDANGSVQINGQVAVMQINGLLAKVVFDQETNREFFVAESFPLDWMYPHLEPHGLIMKINRQPLADLSDEVVNNDSDYWEKYVTPMIGGWLNHDTTVKEVAAFAEKVYVKKDLGGFKGDPQFVQNEYSSRMFSKLRSAHRRALCLARAACRSYR